MSTEFRNSGISAASFSVDSETRGANAKSMRIICMAARIFLDPERESSFPAATCARESLPRRFAAAAGTIVAASRIKGLLALPGMVARQWNAGDRMAYINNQGDDR